MTTYTQASLFYSSQTAVEQANIAGGVRFELSKLTVPAIRVRMLSSLAYMSPELAAAVVAGLGMAVPPAMPRVLAQPAKPEVTRSAALSLTAVPGDGGTRNRSVAILVADGMAGRSLAVARAALQAAGATVHLIAPRQGPQQAMDGQAFEATGTLENSAPVLFDGVQLCDGAAAVKLLGRDVLVMDFISNQRQHGKTLLAIGLSKALLDQAGVPATPADGGVDPGVLSTPAYSSVPVPMPTVRWRTSPALWASTALRNPRQQGRCLDRLFDVKPAGRSAQDLVL